MVGILHFIAQIKRTVAVSSICLKTSLQRQSVYAVSNNNSEEALDLQAKSLGYVKVPMEFALPNQTDAEQIIINYGEAVAVLGGV